MHLPDARQVEDVPTEPLLAAHAFAYATVTVLALAVLVKLRVGLTQSPANIAMMSRMYSLSALPFFAGGAAVSLAISRLSASVNAVYASDLLGAGAGCLLLMPALNRLGAPGAIGPGAARRRGGHQLVRRRRDGACGYSRPDSPSRWPARVSPGRSTSARRRSQEPRGAFSKWNSFSRIAGTSNHTARGR